MIRWPRPGRPRIPKQVQDLIRRMGSENPTSGEERIANELLLKLGIQVSPRTVRKYLPVAKARALRRGPALGNRYEPAEKAIRPFALGRTWLFADTVKGAKASAALCSIVSTARANGLEPDAYLRR